MMIRFEGVEREGGAGEGLGVRERRGGARLGLRRYQCFHLGLVPRL